MTKYKRVDTKNGRTMYFVDGTMKSKDAIPSSVIGLLQPDVELEVNDTPEPQQTKPAPKSDVKMCYFGDAPKTHTRFFNGNTFGVCDEHYKLSLGKIAQLLRESV